MVVVAGIRFQPCGKVYDFEIKEMELKEGDPVIVDSDLGLSIGRVVLTRRIEDAPDKPLKPVIRRASDEDIIRQRDNRASLDEARAFCIERITARGLPMKLVCADVTLDRKRYIFYFTANTRIDFRELVKDLAARFKTRIELRQIGVRDEAKLIGGFGICGREVCCRKFLTAFEPVSIKMAKKQDISLNTAKLSGVCGRLMCCLGFEGATPHSQGSMTHSKGSAASSAATEQAGIICTPEIVSPANSAKEGTAHAGYGSEPTAQREGAPESGSPESGNSEPVNKEQKIEARKAPEGPTDRKRFFRKKKKRFPHSGGGPKK